MLNKLVDGDYGLAKTFWLGVFLGNFIWKLIFGFAYGVRFPSALIALLGVCAVIYFGAVYLGVWNASTKYQGNKLWKYLSRIIVVAGSVMMLLSFFALLGKL